MPGKNATPLIGWHSADPTLKPWIQDEAGRRAITVRELLDDALAAYRAETASRELIARHVEAIAGKYPEDVFPPDSDVRDAISGTAMRHAYRNAGRVIREGWGD
jgi:hypothetical protein